MNILITAFEPFGEDRTNASDQVLQHLPNAMADINTHKLRLPVSFSRCLDPITEYLYSTHIDFIVALGQAGGRPDISIERMAVNQAKAKSPDNDGNQPCLEPIVPHGPQTYHSLLPVAEICARVKSAGIPCHVSDSAGLYVCNTLYYRLLHTFPQIPSVFIHLPYTLRQAVEKTDPVPSMSLKTMTTAIETILSTIPLITL